MPILNAPAFVHSETTCIRQRRRAGTNCIDGTVNFAFALHSQCLLCLCPCVSVCVCVRSMIFVLAAINLYGTRHTEQSSSTIVDRVQLSRVQPLLQPSNIVIIVVNASTTVTHTRHGMRAERPQPRMWLGGTRARARCTITIRHLPNGYEYAHIRPSRAGRDYDELGLGLAIVCQMHK